MQAYFEAAQATRAEVIAARWLALLAPRGAIGLKLGKWTAGVLGGIGDEVGASLIVHGHVDLAFDERRTLAALATCVATWCRRMERFAGTSRQTQRERVRLRAEVATLRGEDLGLVGQSEPMRLLRESLKLVAGHDTPVVLLGASGVGKELCARALHRLSGRDGDGPHVIHCGAIPETLLESALFGHVRGAFTGAERARPGLLRAAGAGTVFLDEVGELSPGAQTKLLRALQERRVTPVGGTRSVPIHARIVSATNRDLEADVRAGVFREDLYYRLAVFPLHVPSLSERREDIPELVARKTRRIARRLGREPPRIPGATMRALCARPWPGNVRQLENELERALILSGETLAWTSPRAPTTGGTFDDIVRAAIEAALARCEGRIYGEHGAAHALGLAPSTLQTKMKKLGIDRARFVP